MIWNLVPKLLRSLWTAIETDTGAKPLQFNSCHNITQKQFDSGVTYVDLMKENVNNLKIALGE